jgi:hypothetical protein
MDLVETLPAGFIEDADSIHHDINVGQRLGKRRFRAAGEIKLDETRARLMA